MRQLRRARRAIAIVILVGCSTIAVSPASAATASLAGRVFDDDGRTARAGATVSLVTEGGELFARSQPTTVEGSFKVEGVEPGSYRLLIEAAEGAYVSAAPLKLAAGANPPLALSLAPAAAQDTPENAPPLPPPGGWPKWAKWAVAGGIGAVGLVLLAEVNDDDDAASPF